MTNEKKPTDEETINWLLGIAVVCLFLGGIFVIGFGYTLLLTAVACAGLAIYGIRKQKAKEAEHDR